MAELKETTLYRKVGKKYEPIKFYEPVGFTAGLWYIKEGSWRNMDYYCKVHKIQNVGKWADIYATHGDKLYSLIGKALQEWVNSNKSLGYSIADLTDIICKVLADIED